MAIESFESFFVGGFEGTDVDAVGSLGSVVGDGGYAVALRRDSDVAVVSRQFQERGLGHVREARAGHQPIPQFVSWAQTLYFSPHNNIIIFLI